MDGEYLDSFYVGAGWDAEPGPLTSADQNQGAGGGG